MMFTVDSLFGISDRIPSDWDGGVVGYDWNLDQLVMEKKGLIHYLGK